MLQVFRTNQLIVSVLFLLYAALLHAYAFLFPSGFSFMPEGTFGNLLSVWLGDQHLLRAIFAYLLVVLQGTILAWISIKNNLSFNTSLLSGLFYILLTSTGVLFLGLSNSLIANTLFIISILELFSIYRKNSCADTLFNLGFWLAIATMFHASCAFFLLLCVFGISSLRSFNLREISMVLAGFFVPFFLVGVYYFWHDKLGFFISETISGFGFLDIPLPPFHWEIWLLLALYGSLILFSLFFSDSFQAKKTIDTQKKVGLLYVSMPVVLFAALFQHNLGFDHLLFLATPLSLFLGIFFSDAEQNKPMANSIHLIWLVGALLFQFYRLF